MEDAKKSESANPTGPEPSTLERFLATVAEKTNDPVHLRLLRACRVSQPTPALEAELQAIVREILNERSAS